MKTYLNLEDVDQIYIRLRGTDRGINSFNVRVKDVAIKKNGAYIFMDEPALFVCRRQLAAGRRGQPRPLYRRRLPTYRRAH